ncbi:hypothetical protein AB0D04_15575 [Streptomyces sp. NPDC048483]|uniref:COG1470 family protein n=1 Tax=Streptomyces sp. NPDC048483 TaxID=3154927 RepID=UPI0034382A76
MPFRTRAAVCGGVLATAAALLCPATAVARPAAPGWSAAPAPGGGARPSAQDRPYFYLEGAPGTVMTDRLALSNPSGRAVTVRLRGSGIGSWLALTTKEVTIPPRTRAGVPFTVTVPRTAAPGNHPGTILATSGGTTGKRARVPVHLRVTGPELTALTVENVSVTGSGESAVVRYALVNRGNTALRPRVAVRAEGIFGEALRRAAHTLPRELRPGQRIDLSEKWPDPPGLDSVDVRVTATAQGGARGSATATYTAVPWAGVAGAVLVLVAGAGGWVLVRKRRTGRDGGGDAGAQEPGGGSPDGSGRAAVQERQLASAGSGGPTRSGTGTGRGTGTGSVPGSGVRT